MENAQDLYSDSYFCFRLFLGSSAINPKKGNKGINRFFNFILNWTSDEYSRDYSIIYLMNSYFSKLSN